VSKRTLFLDTALIQAAFDTRDQYHQKALTLMPLVQAPNTIWVTEAVLVEIGNALSIKNRAIAHSFINRCFADTNFVVVEVTSDLLKKAVKLYGQYKDKDWGLTDCISFVVMREQGLTEALTSDQHFVQAGFRSLLRE
jgi:uncharacterized protein